MRLLIALALSKRKKKPTLLRATTHRNGIGFADSGGGLAVYRNRFATLI